MRIDNLYAGYGGTDVLRGVSAEIPEGAVTALVGANGAGKSTLLGVLAGTVAPRSGTVVPADARRPAFVVQRSAVPDALPLTVRATVAMGRWAHRGWWRPLTRHDRAVVDRCLERTGVADLAHRRLGELSGGQRQRALIAQGLAQEAGLLLLDEPSAGLDHRSMARVRELVSEVASEGVTVVHATHFAEEARDADHVLTLEAGRVAPTGTAV
ncbi:MULTISPECIES: zinc ABC transporter ATP-binding protein AztA [unclassified Nocardiopsis]|uniref:zinc ABC transporter ATP-binding protein AztA n=1 Tax=unclassified Nocardiopsis TaxID=2649073 RepID=UPI00066E592A|nr:MULTISPECIES: zinc ABC transporter ATP-binding protein AztA [unclassified Nocardiopsis]MBQ1082003.1 ABC transporter ATP-binding protein [Nocardiopsis sp. B62]